MAHEIEVTVEGFQQLLDAYDQAADDTRDELGAALERVGRDVQRDIVRRLNPVSSRTAAGYGVRIGKRYVAVGQTLTKTTGFHPEWADYQVRHALLPASAANEDKLERDVDRGLDKMAAQFDRGHV